MKIKEFKELISIIKKNMNPQDFKVVLVSELAVLKGLKEPEIQEAIEKIYLKKVEGL